MILPKLPATRRPPRSTTKAAMTSCVRPAYSTTTRTIGSTDSARCSSGTHSPSTRRCGRFACGRNETELRRFDTPTRRSRTTIRVARRSPRSTARRVSASGGVLMSRVVTVQVPRARRFVSPTCDPSPPSRPRGATRFWISSRCTSTAGVSRCGAAAEGCSSGRGRACWASRAPGSRPLKRYTRPSAAGAPQI